MIDYYQWIDTDTKQPIDCAGELAGQLKQIMPTQEIYQKLYQLRQEVGERQNFKQISASEARRTIDFLEEAKSIFSNDISRQAYDQRLSKHYEQLRQKQEQVIARLEASLVQETDPVEPVSPTSQANANRTWLVVAIVLVMFIVGAIFLNISLSLVFIVALVGLALVLLFRNG